MGVLSKIKQRLSKPVLPVIVAGTDIASYQLIESLKQSKTFSPRYVLNEEPWHHRTLMLGAELRYPSELMALVEKQNIAAVFCVTEQDHQQLLTDYGAGLSQQGCQLQLLTNGQLPNPGDFSKKE